MSIQNSTERSYAQVVYKDTVNGNDLIPIGFEQKGDAIKIKTKPQHKLLKVRTKISVFEHVKDDPQYDCEDYSENNTYSDCIREEIVSKFKNLLGCHPPLISRKNGYCNKKFNMTKEDQRHQEIDKTLLSIIDGFEPSKCKQPCTYTVFESKRLHEIKWASKENRIKIVFSNSVDVTKTTFLITISSFLTGLGGAISGGRTLFWFILIVLGFVNSAWRLQKLVVNKIVRY